MRRVKREGFLQMNLFPLFGFYPWECDECRVKKLLHKRGKRIRKRKRKP